jgi:hypothetical protein
MTASESSRAMPSCRSSMLAPVRSSDPPIWPRAGAPRRASRSPRAGAPSRRPATGRPAARGPPRGHAGPSPRAAAAHRRTPRTATPPPAGTCSPWSSPPPRRRPRTGRGRPPPCSPLPSSPRAAGTRATPGRAARPARAAAASVNVQSSNSSGTSSATWLRSSRPCTSAPRRRMPRGSSRSAGCGTRRARASAGTTCPSPTGSPDGVTSSAAPSAPRPAMPAARRPSPRIHPRPPCCQGSPTLGPFRAPEVAIPSRSAVSPARGRGRHVARGRGAVGDAVAQVDGALRAGGGGLEEREVRGDRAAGEHRLADPRTIGCTQRSSRVEQPLAQEGLHEVEASDHLHVLVPVADLAHRGGQVGPSGTTRPGQVRRAAGRHVLGDPVEQVGDHAVLASLLVRPVAGEMSYVRRPSSRASVPRRRHRPVPRRRRPAAGPASRRTGNRRSSSGPPGACPTRSRVANISMWIRPMRCSRWLGRLGREMHAHGGPNSSSPRMRRCR